MLNEAGEMHQKPLLGKGVTSTSLSVESLLPSWLVRYLTALSVSLATCAFVLQWSGYLDMNDYNDMHMVFWESHNISSSSCLHGPGRDPSFPYYSWRPSSSHNNGIKVCMGITTSVGLEQILPWIFYHKSIGVTQFYVFVEGKAASNDVAIVLDSIPGVTRIHRSFEELEEHKDKSRVWNEMMMPQFMNRPCINEVYIRQSLNMEVAFQMAKEAGMEWIFHLDSDELLYPSGTQNYTVQELLADVPQYVDVIFIVNYESCVERDDIKDPFCEVSMFKKSAPLHLSEETYHKYERTVRRGNPGYYLTYDNGKSGARIQDGLLPKGVHEWNNHRRGEVIELSNDEAAILHYSYTRFSDLSSRGNRCNCKPTKEGAKRCFMLDFDRDAFMISSTSTHEEMLDWYNEQVVWYDKELNDELLRAGVFTRINTPMVILQSLKESGFFANVIASAWQKHEEQKPSTQNQSISGRKFGYMS